MKVNKRLIQIENLSVNYDNIEAIKNITLDIFENDFLAILGPNGGGKTTLIKAILNLIPYEGKITKAKNLKIGYVPQFNTFDKTFPITVLETVLMGAIDKNISIFSKYSKHKIQKAKNLLTKFEMNTHMNSQIGNLSGGQLQKVLICRALMSDCKVLILDEPTASLDANIKTNTYKFLKELNKELAIIIISHDIGALSSYVESFVCINQTLHCNHKHLNDETLKRLYGDHVNFIEHRH